MESLQSCAKPSKYECLGNWTVDEFLWDKYWQLQTIFLLGYWFIRVQRPLPEIIPWTLDDLERSCQWLGARLWYLQCISIGDTAVLPSVPWMKLELPVVSKLKIKLFLLWIHNVCMSTLSLYQRTCKWTMPFLYIIAFNSIHFILYSFYFNNQL